MKETYLWTNVKPNNGKLFNHHYYIAKMENKQIIKQQFEKLNSVIYMNDSITVIGLNEKHTILFYENDRDEIIIKMAIQKQYKALERMER